MKLVTDATFDTSASEPNLSYPGDTCCQLWKDGNYTGDSKKFCYTRTDGLDQFFDMHDYDFNDTVDSWYCGKNIAYDFCDDNVSEDCSHGNGESGAGTSRNPETGHGDDLTGLILGPYDSAKRGAIVVFRDSNCTDTTGRFFAHENPNMMAEFTKADIEFHNTENDDIDAVMVPYGYAVDLFSDDNFSGDVKTIIGEPFRDST